jgi:anthranilate synthase/aminodeoxychorismate synthase-like glutamine amidotransferase
VVAQHFTAKLGEVHDDGHGHADCRRNRSASRNNGELRRVRRRQKEEEPMILIIDNYDSFTYNLVQRLGELGAEIKVFRNDKITLDEIEEQRPDHLIISPGPCTPLEAGISNDVVKRFAGKIPLLGVCLGHQCIAHGLGGKVVRHRRLMHGKTSMITHDGRTIYRGLPNPFEATRYHSLSTPEESLPDCLEVTARAEPDEIMGIRHKKFPLEGVQFHPESFLTMEGPRLLKNFLEMR